MELLVDDTIIEEFTPESKYTIKKILSFIPAVPEVTVDLISLTMRW